jgi:hypothetical protein
MARHLHASWVQDLLLAGTHNRGVWLAVPPHHAILLATCDLRAARLRLALTLFQMETRRPPEKLAELVPTYLDEVPLDPFSGQPFGYVSAAKVAAEAAKQRANVMESARLYANPRLFLALPPRTGIVYAAGPDLVDEGGFGVALPLATQHFLRNPSIYSLDQLNLYSPDLVYAVPLR